MYRYLVLLYFPNYKNLTEIPVACMVSFRLFIQLLITGSDVTIPEKVRTTPLSLNALRMSMISTLAINVIYSRNKVRGMQKDEEKSC